LCEYNKYMNLYEYLNISEYDVDLEGQNDPGRIEIDEFIEAAAKIPKNIIDYNIGNDDLATICLNSCYRAEQFLTKAELFRDFKKINADAVFGSLMVKSELQVTIRKESLKKEIDYVKALGKLHIAQAYVSYFERLKSSFEKTHYMAKGRETRENQDTKLSTYEPHENVRSRYVQNPAGNHQEYEEDEVEQEKPGIQDYNL